VIAGEMSFQGQRDLKPSELVDVAQGGADECMAIHAYGKGATTFRGSGYGSDRDATQPKGWVMKLSEAIRLGAMLGPQGFGWGRDPRRTPCALDAAALAIGVTPDTVTLMDYFPLLDSGAILCTAGCFSHISMDLECLISHLNDEHRWTRERIADWIEANFEESAEQDGEVGVVLEPEPGLVGVD